MKIRFPLLEWLCRMIRNIVLLSIVIFFTYMFFTGASIEISYNVAPKHKYAVKVAPVSLWQKAVKGLGYVKQIRDVWPL